MEALGAGISLPLAHRDNSRLQSDSPDEEINIYLKIMKTAPLKVQKSEKIKNIKTLVSETVGISENIQELVFAGNQLKNEQRLVDYGIENNSTLHLFVQNFVGMNIFIKIPSNQKTIVVKARANDTVQNIKALVQAKEEIQSDEFALVYDGKLLEEDMTLASLNIKTNSTLHLVFCQKDVLSIFIRAPNGEIVKLKLKVLFTIGDVKALIGSMIGVPMSYQSLFYAGKQLEDCKTLACYDIKEESTLELLPSPFQIFVKTWSGKTITLDVNQSSTVDDVKELIFQKLKIPIDLQKILFAGKLLYENRSLSSNNIGKDCTLRMVFAPSSMIVQMQLTDICISVSESTTIGSLKALIKQKKEAPVKEVLFKEVPLRDERSLSYYGIDKNAYLTVVL